MRKLIIGFMAVMTIVLAVGSSASAQETPTTAPAYAEPLTGECGPPDETRYEHNSATGVTNAYNADGQLCSQVAGPASGKTLAYTGSSTLVLALLGFSLLLAGFGALRLRHKYA